MSIDAHADRERTTLPEKVAWILFLLTCLQLVLLKSFVKVVAGLKADVFSAVLCAITLAACLLTARRSSLRASVPEVFVSLGLLGLAVLSGAMSATPWSSSIWSFCLAAYCLGGFWCARILLNSQWRQTFFAWFCVAVLSLLLGLSLWGYYFHGVTQYFVDDLHQFVNVVMLLSFSALTLLGSSRVMVKLIAIAALVECYAALYISAIGGVELGVLIPLAMLIPAFFVGTARPGSRYGLLAVLLIVAVATAHYVTRISSENYSGQHYQAYRLECYAFSVHAAEKHPWLGIGVRAPRDEVLADYRVWHPSLQDKQFASEVKRLVTSQNIFVTFMVGFGIPFAVLYLGAVVVLYGRLLRAVRRPPPKQMVPPMALLIPVTGCLLHFLTMDIMLMPQIAWFFHVLLGMIPAPAQIREEVAAVEKGRVHARTVFVAAAAILATLALGILVGTHPALAPARLPSVAQIRTYISRMPLVAPIIKARKRDVPKKITTTGSLLINFPDYEPVPTRWSVLVLLDNSGSMAKAAEPWTPNRLTAAVEFIESVARAMPEGGRMGIRSFCLSGPFKKGGRDFLPRVSSVVFAWHDTPVGNMLLSLSDLYGPGPNNLCVALQFSVGRDFMVQGESGGGRIVMATDGPGTCPLAEAITQVRSQTGSSGMPIVDLAAIGMSPEYRQSLGEVVRAGGGRLIDIEQPEDVASAANGYVNMISVPTVRPILVLGGDTRFEIFPGEWLRLPAGPYTLELPESKGLAGGMPPVEVAVSPGMTTVVDVSVGEGRAAVSKQDERSYLAQ